MKMYSKLRIILILISSFYFTNCNNGNNKKSGKDIQACDLLTADIIKDVLHVEGVKNNNPVINEPEGKKTISNTACDYSLKGNGKNKVYGNYGVYLGLANYTSKKEAQGWWDGKIKPEEKVEELNSLCDIVYLSVSDDGYCVINIYKDSFVLYLEIINDTDAKETKEKLILIAKKILKKLNDKK